MGGGHRSLKAKRGKKARICPGQALASQRKKENQFGNTRKLEFRARKKGITVFGLKCQLQEDMKGGDSRTVVYHSLSVI